jgi:hypothetical protein
VSLNSVLKVFLKLKKFDTIQEDCSFLKNIFQNFGKNFLTFDLFFKNDNLKNQFRKIAQIG